MRRLTRIRLVWVTQAVADFTPRTECSQWRNLFTEVARRFRRAPRLPDATAACAHGAVAFVAGVTGRLLQRFTRSPGGAIISLCVLAGLGGCVGEFKVQPPRIPTVGTVPPAPVAAVTTEQALNSATIAASRYDLPAVVRALEPLPLEERIIAVRKLMIAIAGQDLARAERVSEAWPVGSVQTAAIEVLARTRVDRDAEAALSWALALSTTAMDSRARPAVAERLVERDAKPALARLRALPASPARDEMLGYAAAAWARRDASAAIAWLRTLAPGAEKDRVTTSIGFALAQSDPPRAVELLAALPEGRDRRVLIGAIGQTWVARDADQAWRWAQQLPEGASREAALAGIETGLGGAGARVARSSSSTGLHPRGGGGSIGEASAPTLGVERDDALRRKFNEALRESPVNAASYLTALPAPDRRDDMIDELVRLSFFFS